MLIPFSFQFYKTFTYKNHSLKLLFETQPTCFLTFAYFQPHVSYGYASHKNECNQENDKRLYCLKLLRDLINSGR